jgi:deoxyguanosine kinase
MSEFKHFAVEGPIGVGKTSLAKIFAKRIGARPILEKTEKNPFLSKFYEDRRTYAFSTQVFFLLSRYQQQQKFLQNDLFNRNTIADYLYAKDRIFAYMNLDDDEIKLYEQIYQNLNPSILPPDLLIFLQASTDVLMKRINKRGQPNDGKITEEYVDELNHVYNHFFFHYDDSPLLIINTSDIDFVKNKDDEELIVDAILNMKEKREYLRPLGSKILD